MLTITIMKNKLAYGITIFTIIAVVLVYITVNNSNNSLNKVETTVNTSTMPINGAPQNTPFNDGSTTGSLKNTVNPLSPSALTANSDPITLKDSLDETCKDRIDPQAEDRMKLRDCVKAYLDNSVTKKGFAATAKNLEIAVGINQEYNLVCHPFAHYIGKGAFDELGSIREAIGDATSFCAWGFLHGLYVQAASEYKGQELYDIMLDGCMYVKELGANYFECAHGMGDAFDVAENMDMMKALSWCSKIEDSGVHANCSQGVVNHWADYYVVNQALAAPEKLTAEQKIILGGNPYSKCEPIKNATDRAGCFDYMVRVNNAYKTGLKDWEKHCNKYTGRDNAECFKGLGREWGFTKTLTFVQAVTKCTLANETDATALCTQEIINAQTQIYQDHKGKIIKEVCNDPTLRKNPGVKKGCVQTAIGLKPYFDGDFKL